MTNENPLHLFQRELRSFREKREWRQFHSPKNLAMSIGIEAAEIMEHFQWITIEESEAIAQNKPETCEAVGEEIADVLMYCLHLADVMGLSVEDILRKKLDKNEKRFPIKTFRGRSH